MSVESGTLAPEGDSVVFQGRLVHVAAWAKRFLFRPEQLDLAVGRLSGGEQARVHIARLMRDRFYDPASGMFLGILDPKPPVANCIFKTEDTDFGHTIKTYWMLYLTGRVLGDSLLVEAFDDQPNT